MRKLAHLSALCCLFLLLPASTSRGLAQSPTAPKPPSRYFRLDFVIEETDSAGKPSNSRTYSTTVITESPVDSAMIRNGSRIPVLTGNDKGNTQYQYIDVGVNIDARNATESGNELAMNLNAEISSLGAGTIPSSPEEPVIRQNRWQARVLLPIGKQTTLFTADNLENKGKMLLLATATPLP
jgi:hypothetical protein